MTILVRKDLGETCILQVEADSALGRGVFCVTDRAVAYEVNRRGIYLNFIPYEMITRFEMSGRGMFGTRRFRISWREDETEHSFELRTRQYRRLYDILCKHLGDPHAAAGSGIRGNTDKTSRTDDDV